MTDKITFAGYTYPENKACLICEHVFDGTSEPGILVHDFDGWLQFLCGEPDHDPERSKTVALSQIIHRLPTESDLSLLKPGFFAERAADGTWDVSKIEDA